MEDCTGGRVRHPATHKEIVRLNHPDHGKETQTGTICLDHKTSADDWEVDGWEVVSMRRTRL